LAAPSCLVLGLISCGNYLIASLVAYMTCRLNNKQLEAKRRRS